LTLAMTSRHRAGVSHPVDGTEAMARNLPLAPVVAVPARNEAERLPALLQALAQQSWLRHGHCLPVVIVLNNCTDNSASVLEDAASRHPGLDVMAMAVEFAPADAHVGSARSLALETAWSTMGRAPSAVLLTTDADARPASDWVDANLMAIDEGADLVGGHIVGDPEEEAQLGPAFLQVSAKHLVYAAVADRLAALVDPIAHDPLPRHGDHTGASLAVLGSVYAAVGGMPPLPFREDLAFVSRCRAAGYRLRHAPEARVQVSARLIGRAPGGMADCLRHWVAEADAHRPHLVEAPASTLLRLQKRRRIRDLATLDPAARRQTLLALGIGDAITLDPPAIARLVETLVPDDPDAAATVPVDAAIAEIKQIIGETEGHRLAA
jgi:GT2 family glycosyltransferase